jgi:hypothetical protein
VQLYVDGKDLAVKLHRIFLDDSGQRRQGLTEKENLQVLRRGELAVPAIWCQLGTQFDVACNVFQLLLSFSIQGLVVFSRMVLCHLAAVFCVRSTSALCLMAIKDVVGQQQSLLMLCCCWCSTA